MSYLSDWKAAEEATGRALALHPNCTQAADCPAGPNPDDHLLDCKLRHRAWMFSLLALGFR